MFVNRYLSALALFACVGLSACNKSGAPSEASMAVLAGKILAECDQEILGRQHQEGERISREQGAALTECMTKKSNNYGEKTPADAAPR